MNEEQNRAVLLDLITHLHIKGSWCGETHIQKASFLLKELTMVPLGFDFILYKHGPFSFDLRDEVNIMIAFGLLSFKTQYPYGPKLVCSEASDAFRLRFPKTLNKFKNQILFIADKIGSSGVVQLEKLATAYYVTQKNPRSELDERAQEMINLKPHIDIQSARTSVKKIDELISEAKSKGLC